MVLLFPPPFFIYMYIQLYGQLSPAHPLEVIE